LYRWSGLNCRNLIYVKKQQKIGENGIGSGGAKILTKTYMAMLKILRLCKFGIT
jgi:hypothetical protein